VNEYIYTPVFKHRTKKAGILIYDPEKDKILIVQSRGNLWGIPKGSFKHERETETECAVRELFEETGLELSEDALSEKITIYNNSIYFFVQKPVCAIRIQGHVSGNDANGVGWISTECLRDMLISKKIGINHHSRLVINHFLNLSLVDYR
jgi:8-oxo-dGTP pyrophosphatase MutT (NUDIX family)